MRDLLVAGGGPSASPPPCTPTEPARRRRARAPHRPDRQGLRRGPDAGCGRRPRRPSNTSVYAVASSLMLNYRSPSRRCPVRSSSRRAASTPSAAEALNYTGTRPVFPPSPSSRRGVSELGISEDFPPRRRAHALRRDQARRRAPDHRVRAPSASRAVVIDRCGVIAGPWQMGKVDQGVFSTGCSRHYFEPSRSYIGFGGSGKQVRDLISHRRRRATVDQQLLDPERWAASVGTSAAGREISLVSRSRLPRCAASSPGRTFRSDRRAADAARRRSDLFLGLPPPLRTHGLAAAARRRATSWRTSHAGSNENERAAGARSLGIEAQLATAIVTGSGGLIGSESVASLRRAGLRRRRARERHARAVLRARRLDAAQSASNSRERYPDEFRWLELDIRDADGVEAAVRRARARTSS